MQLQTKTVRQGINKAYLKVNVKRADLDAFKEEATAYLNNLEHADGESGDLRYYLGIREHALPLAYRSRKTLPSPFKFY